MQYSERICCNSIIIQTRSQSRNEINTHTEHVKNMTIYFNSKEAIWPLMKKKENKKEKLTESFHLMVEMTRRSNYNLDLRKLCINKITESQGAGGGGYSGFQVTGVIEGFWGV